MVTQEHSEHSYVLPDNIGSSDLDLQAPNGAFFLCEERDDEGRGLVAEVPELSEVSGEMRAQIKSDAEIDLGRALKPLVILYGLKPCANVRTLAVAAVVKAPWRDKRFVTSVLGECGTKLPVTARALGYVAGLLFR